MLAIVGPTAIGKSNLAIRLAQTFQGEVVSADSRQVYRYMDIGTAKPDARELSLAPHHLIGIIDPDAEFSLAQYQQAAYAAIDDISSRDKLPMLVGGSGMYVWSVLEGWEIPRIAPDAGFRQDLERQAAEGDGAELYRRLQALDPQAAQQIDPRNIRRVIRALEVYHLGNNPISRLQRKKTPPYNTFIIGLTMERQELYRRIDRRVDNMLEQGLVAEVENLIARGYSFNLPSMSGIGYRQIGMYLEGKLALAEAVQQIKFETHRFVRHQYNWFRLKDARINWYNVTDESDAAIIDSIAIFLRSPGNKPGGAIQ